MSTKKFLFVCAAGLMAFSLAGCNQTTTSSAADPTFSQNTDSIAETMYNLQIVGAISGVSSWDPDKHVGDTKVHFVRQSKMLWTLSGVVIPAGSEFKFTFNDGWNSDFGWKGVYNTGVDVIKNGDLVSADPTKKPADGEDSNIKAVTAGTYNFEYHPFFIAETGVLNKMIIKLAA